jgi:hypothetical protein
MKKEIKCLHCKDTKIIKFKPLEPTCHYSWVPWQTRECEHCKGKTDEKETIA